MLKNVSGSAAASTTTSAEDICVLFEEIVADLPRINTSGLTMDQVSGIFTELYDEGKPTLLESLATIAVVHGADIDTAFRIGRIYAELIASDILFGGAR